eukprot:974754-Pelagomonas_calceolata.AAC.2
MASIMRPEHAGVTKASHESVLHHLMAERWTRVLRFHTKLGSIVLPHRDHLNPLICTAEFFLTKLAKEWGQWEVRLQQGSTMYGRIVWSKMRTDA